MNHTETPKKAKIEYSRTTEGVKFYTVGVYWTVYDHNPRNPSLPVCYSDGLKYGLTYNEAINHLMKFDFSGDIIIK